MTADTTSSDTTTDTTTAALPPVVDAATWQRELDLWMTQQAQRPASPPCVRGNSTADGGAQRPVSARPTGATVHD